MYKLLQPKQLKESDHGLQSVQVTLLKNSLILFGFKIILSTVCKSGVSEPYPIHCLLTPEIACI